MHKSVANCILNAFFAWGDDNNYLTHREWSSDYRDVIRVALDECGKNPEDMPWTTDLRHRLGMHDPVTQTDPPTANIPARATVKQLRELLSEYPDDAFVEIELHNSTKIDHIEHVMKRIDEALHDAKRSIKYSVEALEDNWRDGDHLMINGTARLMSLSDDSIVVIR